MSLESIVEHILGEAEAQKQKIILSAEAEKARIIDEAKLEAERLYRQMLDKERQACLFQKQKEIVNARLGARKGLLAAKQELISEVLLRLKSAARGDRFKKMQICAEKTQEVNVDIDAYLDKIRLEHENEIAKILFT